MKLERDKKRKLNLLEQRMLSIVKSTTGENDIKIKVGDEWAYNVEKKIISYAIDGKHSVFEMTESEVISILLHEIAHAKYSDSISHIDFPEPAKEYIRMLNAIEDIRIERKLMMEYPGTYDSFKRNVDRVDRLIGDFGLADIPEHIEYLFNVHRLEWRLPLVTKSKKVKKLVNETEELLYKAFFCKSSLELHTFLENNLWDKFKQLIPPPDYKGESEGTSSDETKKQISEAMEIKEIVDAVKASVQEKEKEKSGEKHSKKEQQEDSSGEESREEEKLIDKLERELEKENEVEQEERIQAKPTVIDAKIEKVLDDRYYSQQAKTYEELYDEIEPYISYFVRQLKSIMVDNQLQRYGGRYRSGKLNNQLLYKWKCNSTKVFSKKIHRLHQEYSVCLLVDESGSMTGSKILRTAQATVLLAEVLNRVGIDFEICGFNGSERIYKKYNDTFSWSIKRNLENIIPSAYTDDATYNNDGFAINCANYRLQQRNGEKILIVLSDGSPEESHGLIPEFDRRRLPERYRTYVDFDLSEEIMKAKQNAILIGVGILAKHVQDYYPQNVVCEEVSELPLLLLNILRRNIKRG